MTVRRRRARTLTLVLTAGVATTVAAPIAPAAAPHELVSDATLVPAVLVSGSLAPQLDALQPVTFAPGTIVPVSGARVVAGQQVRVGGQWSPIRAAPGGGLGFALGAVPAGTQSVVLGSGAPPAPIPGSRSQPLSVRPAITDMTASAGELRVTLTLVVVAGQEVALELIGADPSQDPATTRLGMTATEAAADLTFSMPSLPAGPYLASVSVDGVASAQSHAFDNP